jgi:hypothetical protein
MFSACFPCYNVNVVSDDEDSDYHVIARRSKRNKFPNETEPRKTRPKMTSFSTTHVPPHEIPNDKQSPKDMLMGYHMRFGHSPFDRLQQAACPAPKCPSCLFAKAKRRPWRNRAQAGKIGKTATKPGDMFSVDQLVSKPPGLLAAQSTGTLTNRWHTVATIFVDHASGLDFVHPQESTSAKHTLEAKAAFERFAARHHVKIQHYHCDNGIFASKKFRAAVEKANQTITFCGVNAHHQNGIAERRIQDLTDRTRAMLVNARHKKNPFATDHLWPFALRHASESDRTIPKRANIKSSLEIFTDVAVCPKTNHFHPLGCPVYVLNAPLQAGQSQPKWQERARVGCYLGLSPQHATSVSLILHPRHGLVSPQFHCVFDDNFEILSDLGRFATLWPQHAKIPVKNPPADDYSATPVPSGITPPWFLRDEDDDSTVASATASDESTLDEGDPEDIFDFGTATDHVYDVPLTSHRLTSHPITMLKTTMEKMRELVKGPQQKREPELAKEREQKREPALAKVREPELTPTQKQKRESELTPNTNLIEKRVLLLLSRVVLDERSRSLTRFLILRRIPGPSTPLSLRNSLSPIFVPIW